MWSVTLTTEVRAAARHRAALASVPGRFAVVEKDDADVHVVSGRVASWVEQAEQAISRGAQAVVLTQPVPVARDRAQQLAVTAADAGVIVAVDSPYACDAAWIDALARVRDDAVSAVVLDSVVSASALGGAFLAQLAVVRPLVPALGLADVSGPSERHYVIADIGHHVAVTLTGVVSRDRTGDGLSLDVVTPRRRWRVCFPAPALALPTEVVRMDAGGQHAARPRYESGLRTTWRALHGALDGHTPPAYQLDDLIADLALAEGVAQRSTSSGTNS